MKKLLCIFLSLIMLFLFASCGGNNAPSGSLTSFTAETLDGETVDQSIFEGKITMVNIWATFCTPCIREMPDLQRLHEDYADKGLQVVGICCDIYGADGKYDESDTAIAKAIVRDTGVKYLNLLPSADLRKAKIDSVTSVPETFFVDEKGNVIGQSYIGSRSYDAWAEIIDSILENQK